jgi:hypothetical protein
MSSCDESNFELTSHHGADMKYPCLIPLSVSFLNPKWSRNLKDKLIIMRGQAFFINNIITCMRTMEGR